MRAIKFVPHLACGFLTVNAAFGHEFWVSPESFVYSPEEQVQANLKVGQDFSGSSYSFNENNFTQFQTYMNGVPTDVTGRLGDIPALSVTAPQEGLLTIVHETDDSQLSYTDWDKFTKFAEHKAFPTTLEDHVARGIPKNEKFVENYRRFAKSLIAIGTGEGQDQQIGLRTEIVALENPYRTEGDSIPVKVFFEGRAKPDTQVELFERAADGTVDITLHQTDANGEALIPVKRGYTYLVDAVSMVPLKNDDPANGPVWESLWASLTFMVPDAPLK